MIKAVFLDLDGTLMNVNNEISLKNINTIKYIANHYNIYFFLATGRPPQDIQKYYQELNLYTPVISMNGSYIIDINKNKIIKEESIPLLIVEKIRQECVKYPISLIFYHGSNAITEKKYLILKKEIQYSTNNINIISFDKILKNWHKNNINPHKIGIIAKKEDTLINICIHLKKKFKKILNIHRSQSNFIEVIKYNTSKAKAISFLSKKYSFKRENILAIGDSDNDISMLKFAGIGIAMGNAKDSVKKYANAITLSNEEDGVAFALEKYIINKI